MTLDIVEHYLAVVSVLGIVAVTLADWGQCKGVHLLLPVHLIVERLHLVGVLLHTSHSDFGRLDWRAIVRVEDILFSEGAMASLVGYFQVVGDRIVVQHTGVVLGFLALRLDWRSSILHLLV